MRIIEDEKIEKAIELLDGKSYYILADAGCKGLRSLLTELLDWRRGAQAVTAKEQEHPER